MDLLRKIRKTISSVNRKIQKHRFEVYLPFMRQYEQRAMEIIEIIKPSYKQYVMQVSTSSMAISLESATFLRFMCEGYEPKHILDLGSGFSSYVFRGYAQNEEEVSVCSVDDDPEWLSKTQNYLASSNLVTDSLLSWDEFKHGKHKRYDLIFHDLGDMEVRKNALDLVFELGREGKSIIILDDIHKPYYIDYIQAHLNHFSHAFFSLCQYTLDKHGRYCGLLWMCDT